MSSTTELIARFRTWSVVPTVVDTLGIEDRSPGLIDIGRAELALEAAPFSILVATIDAFFAGELEEALTGPEAAKAEVEVRRIIGEHLAGADLRLAVGATILPEVDWDTVDLANLAYVALQRAADRRFVEIVSEAAAKVPS